MGNDVASQKEGYAASEIHVDGTDRYASTRAYRESFSGHERNHLFLNDPMDGQAHFVDISGVSGLDSPMDARSFVLWDFDRDGWQDVAVINTNAPRLEMWRNTLGDSNRLHESWTGIRFEGANQSAQADPTRSNRDGFGARVVLELGDQEIMREHHQSEGLSAQNSTTVLVGLGQVEQIDKLSVRWPSGKLSEATDLPVGKLLTLWEDPSQSPTGEALVVSEYHIGEPMGERASPQTAEAHSLNLAAERFPSPKTKLFVYTSMGSECASCIAELPYLEAIQAAFPGDQVAFLGLPMDPKDSAADLEAWNAARKPPYRLLTDITPAERKHVEDLIHASDAPLGLGNTVITDANGRVLKIRYGPSSVSEIRSKL